ncbi:integrase arm-type DNA-binding domain-containing protein [Cloacibacillus sp. An23]|uniref:tyrosine-type recombinase/integrase n=1 Tax=Cloacibacillus sp. An23 TaxID=1965591 RepID=UPI000B39E0A3|nr:integrase arm-type DNA-binding domain-containing protein [Cloacibacillus sp. An23]OUO94753.1 hypothetical protein B5F39_02480 [Cloacibacillus sp. An23]
MALTEKTLAKEIKKAMESGRRGTIMDEGGLFLEVFPQTGHKSWRIRYSLHGKEKKKKIGEYPLMSLKEARAIRDEARAKILRGINPETPDIEKVKLKDVYAEWIEKRLCKECTPTHVYKTGLRMKRVLAEYGEYPIGAVTSSELVRVLHEIQDEGHVETAHMVRQLCGQMFRYAIAAGYTKYDPTYALRGALTRVVSKNLARITEPEEVGRFLRDIRDRVNSPTMKIMLQMHAYTFVRPGEIRRAEWSEFDLKHKEWRIPAEKMKMRRPHIVPLASQVIALLDDLRVMTGHGRYLFHGLCSWDGSRCISEGAENKILREHGYGHDVMVAHGFRGMASTLLNSSMLFRPDVIEVQLSHIDHNTVRLTYNDADYMEQRRVMMQWYADYLDSLRDGTPIPPKP